MTTYELLTEVFREVFDNEDLHINEETTVNDVEGWDSLSHVNLIVAIEMKFKIRFLQKELLTFKNVGDLLNSINKKITA